MAEPIPNNRAIFVGIDPDCDKSGVAIWRPHDKFYRLATHKFFEIYSILEAMRYDIRLVVIEAGWLNKSVWHGASGKGASVAARIGRNVGGNHEAGRKIAEMCEHLKLYYELVRPTRTKLNKDEFRRVTGIKERTNQETRDAMMLIFGRT